MKKAHNRDVWYRMSVAAAVCLVWSSIAQAKGYSPNAPTPNADSQEDERRLNRIEDQQKRLEDTLTAELRQLRAELNDAKAKYITKTSETSRK